MRRLLTVVLALTPCGLLLHVPPASALQCGVWRWPVKTLSDPAATQVNYTPRRTTVRHLRLLAPPSSLSSDTPRIRPLEYQTWRVRAKLVEAVREDDQDYHVVIRVPSAPRKTMIIEFPDVSCNGARTSPIRAAMRHARTQFENLCGSVSTSFVDLRGRVRVTGVGFWDEIHGQTGVAPNGIELHPVLRFAGSCRRA
jgi:hypothetical protein